MKTFCYLLFSLFGLSAFAQIPIYNYSSGTWNTTSMSINSGLQQTTISTFNRAHRDKLKKKYSRPDQRNRRSAGISNNGTLAAAQSSFYRSFNCLTCTALANRGNRSVSYYHNLILDFDTELLLRGGKVDDLVDILSQVYIQAWQVKKPGQNLNEHQIASLKELIWEALVHPRNKLSRASDREKQEAYEDFAFRTQQMLSYNQSVSSRIFAVKRANELIQDCLKPLNIYSYELEADGFKKR
ncbi:MAG: hypothetical protein R8P61_16850 [Bacteroidia bacterium]|nr:hypothetical protein [Bacteroidia bacterium]